MGYNERERLKRGGAQHILAWYARSLDNRKYDVLEHPTFDDYARGVMASDYALDFITKNEELRRRFPPRPLKGLGPGLAWKPPKRHAHIRTRCRVILEQVRGYARVACNRAPQVMRRLDPADWKLTP